MDEFPNGKYDSCVLDKKYEQLEKQHEETYDKFKVIREEKQQLWDILSRVNKGRGNSQPTQQKKKSQVQEI